MQSKYKDLKLLGPNAARLIATLYDEQRPIFQFQEAERILFGRARASKTLAQMIRHGIVTRLVSGKFSLVPFELGFESEYLGNPFAVARELSLGRRKGVKNHYYLSHASAFEIHNMATQPQFVIYTSTLKMIRPRIIQGTEFKFITTKSTDFFGTTEVWVDKNQKVLISDLERTLIDGLKIPSYCGGFSEVAKAFTIKRETINAEKIIQYALKLNVGSVNCTVSIPIRTLSNWQCIPFRAFKIQANCYLPLIGSGFPF